MLLRSILVALVFLLACTAQPPRRSDEPDRAAEYYAMRRAGSDDPIRDLARAREAMRGMRKIATNATSTRPFDEWRFLGPGNIGGRTRVLVIQPDNPDVMYAGGVSGGIWKTANGGAAWKPIGDDLVNIAINSLVMHPNDPRILFAGTGEGYFREEVRGTGLPLRGNGIFVTADGGDTWTQLPSTANPEFHFVNDLVISAHDPSRIYAATRTGVWRSVNSGADWQHILETSAKGGCLELAWRGDTQNDYVFASCGTLDQATVYRTKHAETTPDWESVLSEPNQGRTSIAIAPSNPSIVYALAASNESGTKNQGVLGVYRSTSSGDAGSWQPRATNTSNDRIATLLLSNVYAGTRTTCIGAGASNQHVPMGWYTNTIAVDPVDPQRVWIGSVDLFRSDDGGATWGVASYWWDNFGDPVPSWVHADQHAIVFHPQYDGVNNRTMYFANDGGLFRTSNPHATIGYGAGAACNSASSLISFQQINHNYGVTQFYHGAVFPDGRTFIGGTQDNGTIVGTIDDGIDHWWTVLGGDGAYVAVDPQDPNYVYAESQFGAFTRSTNGGRLFRGANTGLQSEQFLFVTPFALDPKVPNRIWIGGRRMLRTENRGNLWLPASPQLGGHVSAIAISPASSDHVLAGTTEGTIARTNTATTNAPSTPWMTTRLREGWVSSLTFDPVDANVVYATYAGFGGAHVWKSADGGTTWTSIDGNLPDMPVHSIAVDPTLRTRLFLGTDLGVFVSVDGGAQWSVENTGFANAVTEAVFIGPGDLGPAVYAFTHGRGAWRAELTITGPKRRSVR